METRYTLRLNKEKLRYAADMLRYDCAFEVEVNGDQAVISCLRFTPERWRSFGVLPEVISRWKITEKEARPLFQKAEGFTEGIRFAQAMLGAILVQPR